jgi:uncharacterized membrane protein YbhN (UPF0104 family)
MHASLRRHNAKLVVTLATVIATAVGGLVAFRKMDFSFVRGLSGRSFAYIVPLFIVYQIAAVQAHALLMRGMGYRVTWGRLATELFAAYWRRIAGASGTGITGRAPAMAVLYCVELGLTIVIALFGLRYFLPDSTSGDLIWLALLVVSIVAFSILFHLSSPKVRRFPGLGRRLTGFLTDLRDGMRRTNTATFAALVGLALTRRVVLACTSYLLLEDLGNYLPLEGVIFVQSSAIFVGFASMIPLGLGTRDATTFLLYTIAGLRPEVSAAMAALERLVWTLAPLGLGIVCTAVSAVYRKSSGGRVA